MRSTLALREAVLHANLELVRRGLVLYTWGNASGIDRAAGLIAIKPSGVDYGGMSADDIVVTDLQGRVMEGRLKPSSDLETHLVLYEAFPALGGIVHTHSEFATAWAQAGRAIPALGTTHADYFHGEVPVTAELSGEEIGGAYERNTGHAIVRRFRGGEGASATDGTAVSIDPMAVPGVLLAGHAPFAWGKTPAEAAYHATVLEAVARIGYYTMTLNAAARGVSQELLDRHHFRKHGPGATYGQG